MHSIVLIDSYVYLTATIALFLVLGFGIYSRHKKNNSKNK